jgi:NAD(P)-dependent dehydrogenase (short-subunit alcohol dehydrogenase family)
LKADQLFNVKDHIALVTGAASGLGLAMAEVMAENGARVVLVDIDASGLERAIARLRANGCEVEQKVVDVRNTTLLRQAIDDTAARHGRLDAVFANAGISSGPGFLTPVGVIEAVQQANWDNVIAINLTSVFVTLQTAAVHMKKQRSGRIIVTSSIAGLRSEPLVGYPYTATKAAVANLVRHAATELAPFNVMVNGIAPGAFDTNIAGGRLKDPEVRKQFATMAPIGRIAAPDELKGLALLLASPASSYLTGTVIPIDGGATAS